MQPWFHAIENMTIDNVRYVYWKGAIVEHYESPWTYSEYAKESVQELDSVKETSMERNLYLRWVKQSMVRA